MTTSKTYNLQQVLIGWIVNNNPSAVKGVLIDNSLISATSNPGKAEMAKILYSYYLSNGNTALLAILKQVPVNPNTPESEKVALANAYDEIISANSGNRVSVYQSSERISDQSTDKWWNDVLDVVLGSSTTITQPVVTTTTTTSPLVIGALIAAVLLVLGLAYFFIGKRGVA